MTKDLPENIGPAGAQLWRSVTRDYELRADELCILEDACRERDMLVRLESALDGASLLVSGSMGQVVVNPLVSELRQHRTTFATLMGKLKLPDANGSDQGGALSAKNRAAAQARWSSRGA